LRTAGDYGIIPLEREEAKRILAEAKRFLQDVKKYLTVAGYRFEKDIK